MTIIQGHKKSGQHENIYIHHADSYHSALKIIRTKTFNVMVVDYLLPESSDESAGTNTGEHGNGVLEPEQVSQQQQDQQVQPCLKEDTEDGNTLELEQEDSDQSFWNDVMSEGNGDGDMDKERDRNGEKVWERQGQTQTVQGQGDQATSNVADVFLNSASVPQFTRNRNDSILSVESVITQHPLSGPGAASPRTSVVEIYDADGVSYSFTRPSRNNDVDADLDSKNHGAIYYDTDKSEEKKTGENETNMNLNMNTGPHERARTQEQEPASSDTHMNTHGQNQDHKQMNHGGMSRMPQRSTSNSSFSDLAELSSLIMQEPLVMGMDRDRDRDRDWDKVGKKGPSTAVDRTLFRQHGLSLDCVDEDEELEEEEPTCGDFRIMNDPFVLHEMYVNMEGLCLELWLLLFTVGCLIPYLVVH